MADVSLKLNVNTDAFKQAANKFQVDHDRLMGALIFDQHRLWTQDLMKRTPPKTLKQGREAIRRDIEKVLIPLDFKEVLDYFAEQFGTKGRGKKTKSVVHKNMPDVVFNWQNNETRMRGYHERFRTGPNKGVRFKSRSVAKFGPFKFGSGMYVTKSKQNSYIRKRQKSVGKLKAGWVAAADRFGAKGIPNFVRGHSEKGAFTVSNQDNRNIVLQSINRIPWSERRLNSLVKFTQRVRDLDVRRNLKIRINQVVQRFNAA